MVKLLLSIALSIILFCFVSPQQHAKLSPDLANMNKVWEIYQRQIPVAGELRAGVISTPVSGKKINPERFYVYLPPSRIGTTLAVTIKSIDGKYSSNLKYNVKNTPNGTLELDLPSIYQNELQAYTADELAILAHLMNDNPKSMISYVVSSWEDNLKKSSDIVIYLHSKVPTFIDFSTSRGTESIRCLDIDNPLRTAYSCKCTLPKAKIDTVENFRIRQRIPNGNNAQISRQAINIKH